MEGELVGFVGTEKARRLVHSSREFDVVRRFLGLLFLPGEAPNSLPYALTLEEIHALIPYRFNMILVDLLVEDGFVIKVGPNDPIMCHFPGGFDGRFTNDKISRADYITNALAFIKMKSKLV